MKGRLFGASVLMHGLVFSAVAMVGSSTQAQALETGRGLLNHPLECVYKIQTQPIFYKTNVLKALLGEPV